MINLDSMHRGTDAQARARILRRSIKVNVLLYVVANQHIDVKAKGILYAVRFC